MTLPIDSAALTAQATAEHEYGERLMSAAEILARADGAEVVTARHIERAAKALLIAEQCKPLRCVCAEKYGVAKTA